MPVKTIRASRGSSRLTFLRLCSRAPRITSRFDAPPKVAPGIRTRVNDALVIRIPAPGKTCWQSRGLAKPLRTDAVPHEVDNAVEARLRVVGVLSIGTGVSRGRH